MLFAVLIASISQMQIADHSELHIAPLLGVERGE
jgi:hypothetical protein